MREHILPNVMPLIFANLVLRIPEPFARGFVELPGSGRSACSHVGQDDAECTPVRRVYAPRMVVADSARLGIDLPQPSLRVDR